MKTISILIVTILTSFCLSVTLWAETEKSSQTNIQNLQGQYETALLQSLARLEQIQKNHIYKLRVINESIEKTIQAVKTLVENQNYEQAKLLLLEARHLHGDNALAELVLADVFEKTGNVSESNNAYLAFLTKASFASSLSQDTMSWQARTIFAEYVRTKLAARGIYPQKPEGLKQLPLIGRLQIEKNSMWLATVAVGLPAANLIAFFFLIFGYVVTDGDASKSAWYRYFGWLCVVLLLSYILWALHLFLRIPPIFGSEEVEVTYFLAAGCVVITVLQIREAYIKSKKKLSDPNLIPCPHCKNRVHKLDAVCSKCHQDL